MRLASVFVLIVLAMRGGEACAQSAPGSHFNRTTSGGGGASTSSPTASRRAYAGFERTASASRLGADPLAPYTSRPRAGSGSPSVATPPPARGPAPVVVSRNYFPSGRSGQVRHHCTPSRAGVYGNRR
ncbi:hypothetical protein [Paludisphaera soli]|uniref:hypothetical protein n=1 Tax=Paludisphaera soli TaxID=2712865 RepID=UPI0013EA1C0D|nr:hypothetical protein [Paludisphaera soli]